MLPFELHSPTRLPDALELLNRHGEAARPISGGTALVLLMQQRLVLPEHLVALGRIPELQQLKANGSLTVGAAVPHRVLERHPAAQAGWPMLTHTYTRVATVRVRNVATVGGGIAHADPNQDPPATLIALDAVIGVASATGTREIPAEAMFVGYYESALQPGEIVSYVRVPKPSPQLRWAYLKFLPRTEDDYATVAVAAALEIAGDQRITQARLALNAVGPTPVRAHAAEALLLNQTPSEELFRAAAATVPPLCDPVSDHRGSGNYKQRMAEVFTRRALMQAAGLAPSA
jgi:carbon-monoxide dehydrogenase medium subunit